ncbi:MAG: hypothetical protein IKT03_08145 [Muribaculaceae bacterium]|nr:hypothetical protein [Muribaculaceae bacterium]MBR6490487.1 hypothetical protein [Muribaculaceae bacterium]
MNKIVKYLIVLLSFFSISISVNTFPVNTGCRLGGEVLDVDTVVQTEPHKMICTTTITEPIKHPLWVVDGKSYGNLELDSVMLSAKSAEELIPMVLNSIGISISAEEIKDYTILPSNIGNAVYGVRGSAGAIVITTKRNKQ